MITLRGITRFCVETLNTNAEFITLCNSLLSTTFTYYVNIDHRVTEATLPYFSAVTYNDEDDKEVSKSFKTIFLIGIERQKPVTVNDITEEPTLATLETIARKAIELIAKDMRIFGVEGDKNIKFDYINYYVPNPEGENDLQMQIDIGFEQEKFLGC